MTIEAIGRGVAGAAAVSAIFLEALAVTIVKCAAVACFILTTFCFFTMLYVIGPLFVSAARGLQRIVHLIDLPPAPPLLNDELDHLEENPLAEGNIEGGDILAILAQLFAPSSFPSSEDFLSFFGNLDEPSRQALKDSDPEIFTFVPALMVFSYGCGERKNEPSIPSYFQGAMREEIEALRDNPPPPRVVFQLRGIFRSVDRFENGPFSNEILPHINRLKGVGYNLPPDFWGELGTAAGAL